MRSARLALLGTGTAYAVALGWAARVLPERVPAHFDAGGRVDGWSSRTAVLGFWAAIGLLLLAGIPALARVATTGDGTWVNLPPAWKDHWLAPERRGELVRKLRDDLETFAALTGVLLLAGLSLTTWVGATGRDRAPWPVLPAMVGGYLVATAWWCLHLRRSYRPTE